MGIWGSGPFDNDDAADWVYELEESQDYILILDTFLAVTQSEGYLELPEAARAIAAAEVLAAALGEVEPGLPEEVQAWVSMHPITETGDLPGLALRAIGQVRTSSELQELWEEAEEKDAWLQNLAGLEARLRVAL